MGSYFTSSMPQDERFNTDINQPVDLYGHSAKDDIQADDPTNANERAWLASQMIKRDYPRPKSRPKGGPKAGTIKPRVA